MKIIFFSGLAGGSGKTTMAINFARYLHYYEKRQVLLLCCDVPSILPLVQEQYPFPFAARDISPSGAAGYIQSLAADLQAPEFLIVDMPSSPDPQALKLLPLAQVHIVPFEYSMVHYGKLSTFLALLKKWAPASLPLVLPNKVSRPNKAVKNIIESQVLVNKASVLPFIATSIVHATTSAAPFKPQEFQQLRPCFSHILNKI